jgi:hypothetical protein
MLKDESGEGLPLICADCRSSDSSRCAWVALLFNCFIQVDESALQQTRGSPLLRATPG